MLEFIVGMIVGGMFSNSNNSDSDLKSYVSSGPSATYDPEFWKIISRKRMPKRWINYEEHQKMICRSDFLANGTEIAKKQRLVGFLRGVKIYLLKENQ